MKLIVKNSKIIRVYDSIDEMPIVNYQKYNKYLLIDSGIGSDINDIDTHIVRIAKLINSDRREDALKELQNMRQNLYMVNSEISPKYLAFAALVHSIDGRPVTDISDNGLKAVLKEIQNVKHSSLLSALAEFKKKVDSELSAYFPGDFENPKVKEAYDMIKKRTLLVLDSVINEEHNNDKEIEDIDVYLFGMYHPNVFIGSSSVEIKYDKQFDNSCILISQKANLDARSMTVLQFYNVLDIIKKQCEAEAKLYRKHKV